MDHDLDNDKRNITISRLPKALYAELAQAAGEQRRPVANLIRNILADWAVARAREAA
jgi:CopG-like RHH_1 or ribbon-helix-helix domain, RHH_5